MGIEIITPPQADETDALCFGLTAITKAISQIDESTVAHGCLGGTYGYGAHYENDVFMMHPYCWCEREDCLWCMIWLSNEKDCTEAEAEAHRAAQEKEIAAKYGEGITSAPNFWHKRSGLAVHWYKWIGRSMEVHNQNGADIAAVMRECMESLPANAIGQGSAACGASPAPTGYTAGD